MTIRTKLAINVLLLLGFSLIVIVILIAMSRKIDQAAARGVLADRIVLGAADMNTITYDYVLNPSERARRQWELKHASLGEIIATATLALEGQRAILERIRHNHAAAAQFFLQILAGDRKKQQASRAARLMIEESKERTVAQLIARSQAMISDAHALAQVSYTEIDRVQTWSFRLIAGAILLSLLIAALISYLIARTINVSLRVLAGETELVAAGNLDRRLPVTGRDEIAKLSLAFNEMTEKLARSSARLGQEIREKDEAREALQRAHDELEDRVAERTQALSRSEQRIAGILASITDCYYALDSQQRVVEINDQALRYFGKRREELLGRSMGEVYPQFIGSAFEEHFSRAVSEGAPVEFDAHSLAVDRWAELHVYPAGDGLAVYFKDITERKRAEEALWERTAELEAANRELEDFCYTIAHDLRAPLRAIDGYSVLLARHCENGLDEESQRRVQLIRANIRNMGQLIDDLLAYAGLGRKAMTFGELDMEALVGEVWREQRAINPDRRMELRMESLPRACGDRTLIRQVLANLLSNAVKFTSLRDPAVIEVGGQDEGAETRYFVKDNGVGFDMAFHHKIFGVFQRLHGVDQYEGTGVGLAIVQRSIHRHGGRVWGEGRVDEGAVFHFTIPRKGSECSG